MDIPFTTILPLIGMFCVVGLGILIYFKDRKSKLNIIFGLLTLVLSVWLFGTFRMFISQTDEEAIFWDRFIYAGIVFVPALMYHFSIVFTKDKGGKKLLILSYIFSFVFLVLIRTDYFISGIFKYSWGVHSQAQVFHNIFLIGFFYFLILTLKNFNRYYKSGVLTTIERLQAKYIFFAFFILIVFGSTAYAPAYNIGIYPFSYLSAVFFTLILAYAILKHHLMNIRVIATEFFVGLIAIVLFMEIILAKSFGEILFRSGTFIAFSFLGWSLVKSVLGEIKRREELEKLTNELQGAYKELKKLDKAKSEFISIASHQLRTPLTVIKGYVSMMLEKTYGTLPEKIEKPLKNIYISNERLLKLVNDLLDMSRIESGKMEMKFEETAVEEIITSVIEELKNVAKEKGVYLKFEKPEKPLQKILIDGDKIRQAVLNLADNAIKYTSNGGITIKLNPALDGTKLKISIKDTGEGMIEEEIARLFESFSRGGAGTRFWTEGTGLGLYVAKKFIDMHKGKIWAESEGKGKGSAFYIELPVK